MIDLDSDLKGNREQVTKLVTEHAPVLLDMTGVGAVTAAVIMTVWRAYPFPGRVRPDRRNVPDSGIIGQHHKAPHEPWRRPPTEPGNQHHRAHTDAHGPGHPRILRTTHRRKANHTRDHPMLEALRHSANPPDPDSVTATTCCLTSIEASVTGYGPDSPRVMPVLLRLGAVDQLGAGRTHPVCREAAERIRDRTIDTNASTATHPNLIAFRAHTSVTRFNQAGPPAAMIEVRPKTRPINGE